MESNLDTVCAASVLGMITSAAGGALSGSLLYSACHSPLATSGYVASNVGNNVFLERTPADEAAADHAETADAPMVVEAVFADDNADQNVDPLSAGAQSRRLLYGGGKASLMTQCVTQILNSMWALAGAALSINAAATTCPPKDIFTQSETVNQKLSFRVPQAKCSADVAGIFTGFLLMITYIESAIISCTDTLNLQAICAEAITGVLATLSLAASSGAGLFLACDQKTRGFIDLAKGLQKLAGAAAANAPGAGNQTAPQTTPEPGLNNNEEPTVGNLFGRRLSSAEELGRAQADAYLAGVKAKFSSPEEAFKSIGFDVNDKHAAFHEHAKVAAAEAKRQAMKLSAEVLAGEAGKKSSTPKTCTR